MTKRHCIGLGKDQNQAREQMDQSKEQIEFFGLNKPAPVAYAKETHNSSAFN